MDELGGAGGNFNEGAPEITRDEIQFDPNDKKSMLGEGSFGSVWKVQFCDSGSFLPSSSSSLSCLVLQHWTIYHL